MSLLQFFALILASLLLANTCIAQSITGCQGMGYDFSPLAVDIPGTGSQTGAGYVLHLCGQVTSSPCGALGSSSYGSMFCQIWPSLASYNTLESVATWNTNITSWSYTNGANYTGGVTLTMFDGATGCSFGMPRLTYINFVCNSAAQIPSYINITEPSYGCVYMVTVQTSIVCASSTAVMPFCTYGGYNFSPLSSYELQGTSSTSGCTYTFKMCGVIQQNTYCTTGNALNAMICQQCGGSTAAGYSVAIYNPAITAISYVGRYNHHRIHRDTDNRHRYHIIS